MRLALITLMMMPLVIGCGGGGDEKPAAADADADADAEIGDPCDGGDVGGVIACDGECLPNVDTSQIGDGACDAWAYCVELDFDGGDCECAGDYAGLTGPECCDGRAADPPIGTGSAAECYLDEWHCEHGLVEELAVCTCGSTDGATPEMATSDCVNSCDDEAGTFPYCVFSDHWECPVGMIFRSTCTDGDDSGSEADADADAD